MRSQLNHGGYVIGQVGIRNRWRSQQFELTGIRGREEVVQFRENKRWL